MSNIINNKYNFGMSSTAIKYIALITMAIDHIGLSYGIYNFRIIGRVSFPLFAFLIVQGTTHTRDIKKYIMNLMVFAFISEIFFDMWLNINYYGYLFMGFNHNMLHQNIFFTLSAGAFCVYLINEYKVMYKIENLFLVIGILFLSYFFNFDYGAKGVMLILIMYITKDNKIKFITFVSMFLLILQSSYIMGVYSLVSVIIMSFYNGEKGNNIIKNKYFFYAFYPMHIFFLTLLEM